MKVDVVIPVHNGAGLVRRAVQSVQAQTVDAVQHIVCIDDASSDDSLAVLHELARRDARVRVLRNERNLGVAATRNRGIRETQNDAVAFLDQDDEWKPDKLERQLAAFAADPACGYAVGRQQMVLAEGRTRPSWARAEWFEGSQMAHLPSSLVVRRATFDTVGVFDESFRSGGDDSDWFARARRLGVPVIEIDAVVMLRHVHDGNGSASRLINGELLELVRRHARASAEEETS